MLPLVDYKSVLLVTDPSSMSCGFWLGVFPNKFWNHTGFWYPFSFVNVPALVF